MATVASRLLLRAAREASLASRTAAAAASRAAAMASRSARVPRSRRHGRRRPLKLGPHMPPQLLLKLPLPYQR